MLSVIRNVNWTVFSDISLVNRRDILFSNKVVRKGKDLKELREQARRKTEKQEKQVLNLLVRLKAYQQWGGQHHCPEMREVKELEELKSESWEPALVGPVGHHKDLLLLRVR